MLCRQKIIRLSDAQFIQTNLMATNIREILILTVLASTVYSEQVIDLAGKFHNYTCFRQQGYSQVIVRAYHSYGVIDLDAKENIRQSNAAGLATDVYLFPCRGKSPSSHANDLLAYLHGMNDPNSAFAYATGTIWLDIQTNPSPSCSWDIGTSQSNCQFIQSLVQELTKRGRAVGIYASHFMWKQILGDADNCKLFTKLPLWYAHYDGETNFDDWESNKFGGWVYPTLKQYTGDARVCNFVVDLSFY